MKLSAIEETLLVSVLSDRERLAKQHPLFWKPGEDRLTWARLRTLVLDAVDGIVPLDWSTWRGSHCGDAERKQNSRAVKRLAELGLIVTHKSRYRDVQSKFIELTETGEQVAKELAANEGKIK